jgi:HEAT repeat protein
VAALVVVLLNTEREPRYRDRTLSQWWGLWSESQSQLEPSAASTEQAAQAIRHIGTNALPFLLRGMRREAQHKDSRKLPLLLRLLPADSVVSRAIPAPVSQRARGIFVILGAQARQAVPELTELLCQTNNPDIARDAAFCLAAIGEPALPPLIGALSKPHLPGCREVAFLLGALGSAEVPPLLSGCDLTAAVPPLCKLATGNDNRLAVIAVSALAHIRRVPDLALPALATSLGSPDPKLRQASVRALASFGATTAITPALNDVDESVRRTATNCLSLVTEARAHPDHDP